MTNNKKTPEQRQFEQTTDKLLSLLDEMEETIINLLPTKGNTCVTCKSTNFLNALSDIGSFINALEVEDFTPNEYSGDFKLSYS